jgi:very-short-patch-repair endonuclease
LWAEGRLVIEIDDQSHWRKDKYAADRQRDFELMRAGFQVLRITADEVLHDTEKAIEKIKILCDPKRTSL